MNVGNVRVGGTRCTEITGEVTSVTEDADTAESIQLAESPPSCAPAPDRRLQLVTRHQSWSAQCGDTWPLLTAMISPPLDFIQ